MKLKYVVLFLVLTVLLETISMAQETLIDTPMPPITEELRSMWANAAGWWLLCVAFGSISLVIGAILLRTGHTSWGKFFGGLGVFVIFIALFLIEYNFFEILGAKKILTYKECKGLFITEGTNIPSDPIINILASFSCVISGFTPEGATPNEFYLATTTFYIFGIIAPLALSIAVMTWALGWIHPTNIRNVIAVCIALMAFRGFFVTLFVEFLSFGAAGVAALLINLILVTAIWQAFIKTLGMLAVITGEEKIMYYAELSRLLEEEKDILRALEIHPNDQYLRQRLDQIRDRIKALMQQAKKEGVPPPPPPSSYP